MAEQSRSPSGRLASSDSSVWWNRTTWPSSSDGAQSDVCWDTKSSRSSMFPSSRCTLEKCQRTREITRSSTSSISLTATSQVPASSATRWTLPALSSQTWAAPLLMHLPSLPLTPACTAGITTCCTAVLSLLALPVQMYKC